MLPSMKVRFWLFVFLVLLSFLGGVVQAGVVHVLKQHDCVEISDGDRVFLRENGTELECVVREQPLFEDNAYEECTPTLSSQKDSPVVSKEAQSMQMRYQRMLEMAVNVEDAKGLDVSLLMNRLAEMDEKNMELEKELQVARKEKEALEKKVSEYEKTDKDVLISEIAVLRAENESLQSKMETKQNLVDSLKVETLSSVPTFKKKVWKKKKRIEDEDDVMGDVGDIKREEPSLFKKAKVD